MEETAGGAAAVAAAAEKDPKTWFNRKIAVMGAPYVGKSSVVIRFCDGGFPEVYESTIEDLLTKRVDLNDKHYLLKVTDTAGQEEYSVFPRSCSFDINGFILVYAIDDRKSFEMITNVYDKIVDVYGDNSIPLVIVGNKTDLDENRCVQKTEGQELANNWDAQFIEISAKNSKEVYDVFDIALKEIEISRGNMIRPVSPKPPPTVIQSLPSQQQLQRPQTPQQRPQTPQQQQHQNNRQNQSRQSLHPNDKEACSIS